MYLKATEQIVTESPDLQEEAEFMDYYIRKAREFDWTCFQLSGVLEQSKLSAYKLICVLTKLEEWGLLVIEYMEAPGQAGKHNSIVIYRITEKATPEKKI